MNARSSSSDKDPPSADDFDWPIPDLVSAIGMLAGKWKVPIVCHLLGGTKRFSQLRRLLRGIGRGMLSFELRQLQRDGIVERKQYETIPPTVEYFLTARGRALKALLEQLGKWGAVKASDDS